MRKKKTTENIKLGDRFNLLEVIKIIDTPKQWQIQANFLGSVNKKNRICSLSQKNMISRTLDCKCDCGKLINIKAHRWLVQKSCGCLMGYKKTNNQEINKEIETRRQANGR